MVKGRKGVNLLNDLIKFEFLWCFIFVVFVESLNNKKIKFVNSKGPYMINAFEVDFST